MKLKFYQLFFILLLTSYSTYSQELLKLTEDRGFREIKLGANIDQFNCFKLDNSLRPHITLALYYAVADEITAYIFTPNEDYPYHKIGDVEIFRITVLAHQGRIFEIGINIKKNNDIFELLKYRYGNYTSFDNTVLPKYSWDIKEGITCKLIGYGKADERLEIKSYVIKYIDNPYWKILSEKNNQKIESIKRAKENELKKQAKNQF